MKRIWSILIAIVLILSFTQDADAAWRGRCYNGYYRPYCGPVVTVRPYYYAPPAPVFQDRWVPAHYRRTPYGDEFIPGHWTRVRVY